MSKIFVGGLAAAALAVPVPALAEAQISTTTGPELPPPVAMSNSFKPTISLNNFSVGFVERTDPGFKDSVSVNPTNLTTIDLDFPTAVPVRVEATWRFDWFNRRPGFASSEYTGLKDLNVQLKIDGISLQIGTPGLWATDAAATLNKDSQWVRNYLGAGGPTAGYIGIRADGKYVTQNVQIIWSGILATGARDLTDSKWDNRDRVYGLCDGPNRLACGLVEGAKADIAWKAYPFLTWHVQETHIENGGALGSEWRTTIGADVKRNLMQNLAFTSEAEFTSGTNYDGSHRTLEVFQSTQAITQWLGGDNSIKVYASLTQAHGDISQTYTIAGIAFTHRWKSNDFISAEIYGGVKRQLGLFITLNRKFDRLNLGPH